MKIEDEGIVLGMSDCGESGCVLVVFTLSHGKIRGFLSSSEKNKGISKGDICHITWRGRLHDQLGKIKPEIITPIFPVIFGNEYKNLVVQSICELLLTYTEEKEVCENLYENTKKCLANLDSLTEYAFWEFNFLKYIGYGLDVSECCVTHETEDLFYISPNTGKAVTRNVGEPYKNKLFKIPEFWKAQNLAQNTSEILGSLEITGHFINKLSLDYSIKFNPIYRNLLTEFLTKIDSKENVASIRMAG